jgi:multisubunit Na+/H+ antiporter MnhC subunit
MSETLYAERGNALLRSANVFVQVRTGAMTLIALEAMMGVIRRLRVGLTGKRGALLVLGERAEMVSPMLRKRQIQWLQEMIADPLMTTAFVVEGATPGAELYRTLARADQKLASNGAVFSTVEEGAHWLAAAVGVEPEALLATAQRARAQASGERVQAQ